MYAYYERDVGRRGVCMLLFFVQWRASQAHAPVKHQLKTWLDVEFFFFLYIYVCDNETQTTRC